MARLTLATVLDELKSEIKKRDARDDIRFEFIKEQIQTNHARAEENFQTLKTEIVQVRTELKSEIAQVRTELKTEIAQVRTELKSEITQVRTELKTEIAHVRRDVSVIRDQTAHITERITTVEGSLRQ